MHYNTVQPMNIEQYERQIFELDCDLERISILQKKSRARVQVVHRKGKCYIRSISDKYKDLRILLLGLMIEVYQRDDQERMRKFKEIVYGSELALMTASRGLLKEELHKNVGMHLRGVKQGEHLENELVKCFNCVAFFDEVLITSFKEHFVTSELEPFDVWQDIISQAFEINVQMDREIDQSQQCLFFQRDGQSIYIPFCKSSLQEDTIIDNASFISLQVQQIGPQVKNNLMTVSIQSYESPANKQNVNHSNHFPQEKISTFQVKLQHSRKRKEKSSFWSMFCCGAD